MYVGPRKRTATIVVADETHVVVETPRDTIVIEKESFDAKYKRTYNQLEAVEEKLNAAQITEEGLRKLIEFYAQDPVARAKAQTEYEEQVKLVQTLKETQAKLVALLNDMYYTGEVPQTQVNDIPNGKQEEKSPPVNKESFEAQYKRLYDQFLTVEV